MEHSNLKLWDPIYIRSGAQMTLGWGDKGLMDMEGGRERGCLPKVAGERRQRGSSRLFTLHPQRPQMSFPAFFPNTAWQNKDPVTGTA